MYMVFLQKGSSVSLDPLRKLTQKLEKVIRKCVFSNESLVRLFFILLKKLRLVYLGWCISIIIT
jgi:hypothetical protein